MSLVKNISGGPLDVPVLGRVVEDGEVTAVPDFQPDGVSPIVWPPDKWEPAGPLPPPADDEKGM
jgi:hypothetical protein